MSLIAPYDVVFDLDGTLIDSVGLCTEIMNQMLSERGAGRVLSLAEARPHITLGGLKMIEALFEEDGAAADRSLAEFRSRYANLPTPDSSLFPEVRDGLKQLTQEGLRLSVCSNKPQTLCDKVVADLGLGALFAAVVGSDPALPLKPDPALLDRTLALVGGARTRCVYVGDAEVDEALAERAGVRLVFVTWGYSEAGWTSATPWQADRFSLVPDQIRSAMNGLAV